MSTQTELEQLLQDRFEITTEDLVTVLKLLPSSRPWAASLTAGEARLLDEAGFADDRDAWVAAETEIAGYAARLAVTAFTADEVATGLGISASRVRQKRLAGELWAIADGQSWVFPVLQFETSDSGGPRRLIRGLDRILKALPADVHPVAVAGFLLTPQLELVSGSAMTPLQWLREGGDIETAVAVAAATDWYTA